MLIKIQHASRYSFSEPPVHGLQRLRLTPKATQGQAVLDWSMSYKGAKLELEYDDQNFNHTTLISVESDAKEVTITCSGLVKTSGNLGVLGYHSGHLPLWSFLALTDRTRPGPGMRSLISSIREKDDTLDRLHGLSAAILEDVKYETGVTHVHTSAEEAYSEGAGVCQDHAHIFIGAARSLDIPARYVSGYLMMDDRIEQEATHAWAEAFVDGLGWVGFDVSNGISPDERYIRVATGRDYREAAPVTGISFGGIEEELHVELEVEQQRQEQ
jgi:transglutaminase-like putative cysteine protease